MIRNSWRGVAERNLCRIRPEMAKVHDFVVEHQVVTGTQDDGVKSSDII